MNPTVVLVLGLLPLAVFVMWPLFATGAEEPMAAHIEDPAAALQRQKIHAYSALKEAEFDRRTGKLSDEDYEKLVARFKGQAMEAIGKLEKLRDARGSAQAPAARGVAEPRFCAGCGAKRVAGAKFCAGCGTPLSAG